MEPNMRGTMIEINPLIWRVPGHNGVFPCFIPGCYQEARCLAKMRQGEVVVQVCLCDACLRKSPRVILESLGIRSQKTLN